MRGRQGVLGLSVVLFLLACSPVDDLDDGGAHGCSVNENIAWVQWGGELIIDHDDPRECPQGLEPNDQGTAGGTIREKCCSNNPTPNSVTIKMYDGYTIGSWSGSGLLGSESEGFDWIEVGGQTVHQAEVWVSYYAGQSPDFGEFRVQLPAGWSTPIAVNTINYYGEQM